MILIPSIIWPVIYSHLNFGLSVKFSSLCHPRISSMRVILWEGTTLIEVVKIIATSNWEIVFDKKPYLRRSYTDLPK